MTIKSSGILSVENDINPELGNPGSTPFSLGSAASRSLAGVPTGLIKMSDFYGKSAGPAIFQTVSANRVYNPGGDGVYYFKAATAAFQAATLGGVPAWTVPAGAAGTMPTVILPSGAVVVAAIPYYQTNGDDYYAIFTDRDTNLASVEYSINGGAVIGLDTSFNKSEVPAGSGQYSFGFALSDNIDALGTVLTVDWQITEA